MGSKSPKPFYEVEYIVGVDVLNFPIIVKHKVPNKEYLKRQQDERSRKGVRR